MIAGIALGKAQRGKGFYQANTYTVLRKEIRTHSSGILILLKRGKLVLFNSCFTYLPELLRKVLPRCHSSQP